MSGVTGSRVGLAAAVLIGLAAGCARPAGGTGAAAGPPPGSGPAGESGGPAPADVEARLPGGAEFAAGKRVYAAHGCARCHKLGDTGGTPPGAGGGPGGGGAKGPPGRGRMRGPDLTAVGAEPEHTADWLAAHVRDPKAHKPDSRMPAFGPEKIPDADLQALAAYLAGRK